MRSPTVILQARNAKEQRANVDENHSGGSMDIVTGAIVLAIAGYAMYRFVKFCGRLGTGIGKP